MCWGLSLNSAFGRNKLMGSNGDVQIPCLVREAIYTATYLGINPILHAEIMKVDRGSAVRLSPTWALVLASCISGTAATVITQPIDTIKTRMQANINLIKYRLVTPIGTTTLHHFILHSVDYQIMWFLTLLCPSFFLIFDIHIDSHTFFLFLMIFDDSTCEKENQKLIVLHYRSYNLILKAMHSRLSLTTCWASVFIFPTFRWQYEFRIRSFLFSQIEIWIWNISEKKKLA